MTYALFALVALMVAGFVWVLLTSSMTVTYLAISVLSLAGIAFLLSATGAHSRDH